jgi:hypothetical protein
VGLSVQERAEYLGTFRWIEVQLMRMLAGWTPSTPEMEAKILFGRHIWDCARTADALGKRSFELRAPLQFTVPALDAYRALLAEAGAFAATADRIGACYDALLPDLAKRYARYVERTDGLMDEPSVRVVETAIADLQRMQGERRRLLTEVELPAASPRIAALARELEALDGFVAHGAENGRARGVRA